jgi:hypothetical protein
VTVNVHAIHLIHTFTAEARMATETPRKERLTLDFKEDTLTTVSRPMLQAMASKLGFNETQTALYALALLRDEVFSEDTAADFTPLTHAQHAAIAAAAPRRRGNIIDHLLPRHRITFN